MSVADRLPRSTATATIGRSLTVLETPAAKSALGTLAWVFLFLAAFADLFTTAYGLGMGARETNPFVRQLLTENGIAAAGILKLIVIGVIAVGSITVYAAERHFRTASPVWWLYYPALAAPIWMGAASWNALQILRVIQ